MQETTFYLMYPVRKSKLGYKKMRIFYLILGLLWVVAAVYLFFNNPTGRILLPLIYFFIGLIMEIMAYFYPVVILGRYVTIGDQKVRVYLSPLHKMVADWEQISSVRLENRTVHFEFNDGKKRSFRLRKLDNRQWKLFNKKLSEAIDGKSVTIK